LFLVSVFTVSFARLGVDLSVATDVNTWKCLKNDHNIEYGIVRAFRSLGAVDINAANSLLAAKEAGISVLSAYTFPCIQSSASAISYNATCGTAQEQLQATLSNLNSNGVYFASASGKQSPPSNAKVVINRLWIDVEDEVPAKYYDADVAVNQVFMKDLVSAMNANDIQIGIYTTKTYWQNIMGNINGYGQYPLWYPRYDSVNTMDFFATFADFDHIEIKQTNGDVGYCGISQVDSDYTTY